MADARTEREILNLLKAQKEARKDLVIGSDEYEAATKRINALESQRVALLNEQKKVAKEQVKIPKEEVPIYKQLEASIKRRLDIQRKLTADTSISATLQRQSVTQQGKLLESIKSKISDAKGEELKFMVEQYDAIEAISSGTNDVAGLNQLIAESKERQKATDHWSNEAIKEDEINLQKVLNTEIERVQAKQKQASELALMDKITGGLASKAKDFSEKLKSASLEEKELIVATATLASGIVILKKLVDLGKEFAKTFDAIGKQFGSINLIGGELQNKLLGANIEAIKLGGNVDDVSSITNNLASNFGITIDEAADLSTKVFDTSKALGLSTDEGANLFGVLTQTANLSAEQAERLSEGAAQLARQRGVAPQAVLRDIASSTETIAEFTKDGGDNIAEAAIQARSLGVSLETSAKVAKSLLDFESSVAAEVEASVLLGRQLNFQKARELALSNDITGAMADVVAQLGSEEEFNRLNLIQREALAKSIGVSTAELAKFVGESEKANAAGSLAGQSFKDLIGEDALNAFTRLSNSLASIGAQIAQSVGPALGVVAGIFADVIGIVGGFIKVLDEAGALMPMLITGLGGVGIALTAVGIKAGIAGSQLVFSAIASIAKAVGLTSVMSMGFGTMAAVAMGAVATAGILGMVAKAKGFNDGGMIGRDGVSPPTPADTVPIMAKPGEIILNEAQQANIESKFNTQTVVQNQVGFTEEQAITMGKTIASQISLETTIAHGDQEIAITPKLGGRI